MSSLKSKFASALVAAGMLTQTGCQTTLTQGEGYAAGAGFGAILGEAAGQNIDDSRLRNAITAGATVVGGTIGGATAAQQGYCTENNGMARNARRDNTTGRVNYDETTQTRTQDCIRRVPNNQNSALGPIF